MKMQESVTDIKVGGKTPEEIKKGLEQCAETETCEHCHYRDDCMKALKNAPLTKDALAYIQQLEYAIDKTTQLMQSAAEVIKKNQERLESTYSQVKKALCGKENASWVEVLEATDQLKSRLAQVEMERDAAENDLRLYAGCKVCEHGDFKFTPECMDCSSDNNNWLWRGVCRENTKEGSPS